MSSALWRARRRGERPVIYGRDRERAQLRELLDDAIAGHGSLALISGEAGIGKTTLVDDLILEAEQRDCLVLTGGCYDLTTTPPYGPWVGVLGAYQPDDEGPAHPEWFGNPEKLEKIGSQVALMEETRSFFAKVATVKPLLMVLEDLHWSDDASLTTLRSLGRYLANEPILLVATYRDDELTRRHPLYQLLPVLVRETAARRVYLNRLDLNDLNALIADRYNLSSTDQRRLADYLQQRSEGNPFYADELLQGLEDDQILYRGESGWEMRELARAHIPSLLRSVTERRLEQFDAPIRKLLDIGAIIGQSVPYEVWLKVSEATEQELAQVVQTALRARLVQEAPDRTGIEFRHALVRETLYSGVIGVHLQRWHRKIAEVLVDWPDAHPDQIAWHFVEAGDHRQVEWLLRAGRRAERAYAWTTAVERYEAALRGMGDDSADMVERGWLLQHISELMRYSDPRLALTYSEEARKIGEDIGDGWLTGYATFRSGYYLVGVGDLGGGIATAMRGCRLLDSGMRAYWQGRNDPNWQLSIHRVFQADLDASAYLGSTEVDEAVPLNMRWGTVVGLLVFTGRLAEARALGEGILPVARWALENVTLSARSLGYADALSSVELIYAVHGHRELLQDLKHGARHEYQRYGHYTMVVNTISRAIEYVVLTSATNLSGGRSF